MYSVYCLIKDGNPFYVGMTSNIKVREKSHRIDKDFDYLLVEGLKTLELPRISIFRDRLDESYFSMTDAIACDETIDKNEIPENIVILDLNNPEELINWIDKNAKRV